MSEIAFSISFIIGFISLGVIVFLIVDKLSQ